MKTTGGSPAQPLTERPARVVRAAADLCGPKDHLLECLEILQQARGAGAGSTAVARVLLAAGGDR
jgi:hypothetical protein